MKDDEDIETNGQIDQSSLAEGGGKGRGALMQVAREVTYVV